MKHEQAPLALLRYRTGQPAARARITLRQHLFSFLLTGEKTVHFAGAQVAVQPRQVVLLAAGNCLMSEKAAARDAEYHSILLFFDSQLLTDFFSRHVALLDRPTGPADPQPFLLFEKDEFLVNFINSLDCLLGGPAPLPLALQQAKLEELLLYLAVYHPGQLRQLRSLGDGAAEDWLVRRAVTAHITSTVTVEELAFLCHMSLSAFKRRFGRLYATSPTKWLVARRMELAARLLRHESRKASELYQELGYENLSSFVQAFKHAYGITPKQYQLLGEKAAGVGAGRA